jgi:hypothetical protein
MAIFSGIWACLTIGQSQKIEPVETLNMSFRSLGKSLIIGYLIGFISWIITLVVFPLFKWQPLDLVFFFLCTENKFFDRGKSGLCQRSHDFLKQSAVLFPRI